MEESQGREGEKKDLLYFIVTKMLSPHGVNPLHKLKVRQKDRAVSGCD